MSEASAHSFQFVPAPAELSGELNSLYVLQVGEGGLDEMLPAYSGQLLVVAVGSGAMDFGRGPETAPGRALLIGPLSSAARFSIAGPAVILGASFNFLGWASIAGEPVAQSSDRFLTIAEVFGEDAEQRLVEIANQVKENPLDSEMALIEIAAILREAHEPLPQSYADLIDRTYAWLSSGLNPPTEKLYRELAYSERQAQRLVRRFFGLPPSRLKRRYRAIRAATLLADPELDPAMRDEVLNAFYDQAHMIREIRMFTGRTPKRLRSQNGSVISETLGASGYSVVDLFGSSEEEQLARNAD